MIEALHGIDVADGAAVATELIPTALTAASLAFGDGATQVFKADATTTYVDQGRETRGGWSIDAQGRYCSFWPPSFRACYDLSWIVEGGEIVGLRFIDLNRGSHSDGRYQLPRAQPTGPGA